jgi:hypothetical protein
LKDDDPTPDLPLYREARPSLGLRLDVSIDIYVELYLGIDINGDTPDSSSTSTSFHPKRESLSILPPFLF